MSNSRAENLERAIAAYHEALEVLKRETTPDLWGQALLRLGEAYSQRLRGHRADNIERAIHCFEQALEVFTRESEPIDWARTLVLLGAAYSERVERGGEETPRSQLAPGTVAKIIGAKVFLSYAREDYSAVRRLFLDLKAAGFEPWLDDENLLPGQKWELEIERAIRTSDFFIALLSARSTSKKGYVQKEIRQALDVLNELPEEAVFFVPARLDDCEPSHPALRRVQRIDLFPVWDTGLRKIIRSLNLSVEAKSPEAFA